MTNDIKNSKVEDVFAGLEVSEPQVAVEVSKPELKPQLPEQISEQPKIQPEKPKLIELNESPKKIEEVTISSQATTASSPVVQASGIYPKVEDILEEDLAEVYFKMSPEKQKEFKIKGEETTLKISQLLQNTKVKVKLIFQLIIKWLSIIPGVNKHFLEQEAKIKTDKLLDIRDKELRK